MIKILVTAGGTATAWHIANVAKKYYPNEIVVQACDTNEPYLVPVSAIVDKMHKVSPTMNLNYPEDIKNIVLEENIDCLIPLIPYEGILFAEDSAFIQELNIKTTAASMKTADLLADKRNMYNTLSTIGIPTPRIYRLQDISKDEVYLLKPRRGFGSSGVIKVIGKDILEKTNSYNLCDNAISEYCHDSDYDEITVEVYNGMAGLHVFPRRRIATKAGVCVKMEPVYNDVFLSYVQKLVKEIECPVAFNVQFLFHKKEWKLFDCNLRLGAGTALSSAAGFQLTRAMLAELSGQVVQEEFFQVKPNIKSVLRVYQEIIIT